MITNGAGKLALCMAVSITSALHAQPVSVRFDAVNNFGIQHIWADGKDLLVGCGFNFIGSEGTTDDCNNVSSCDGTADAIMRPICSGKTNPNMPFNLTFQRDTQAPNIMHFTGSIGSSSNYSFAIMEMPMDCSRDFTYFRYAGSPELRRYDQNPPSYTSPAGDSFFIFFAPGSPQWGEIIGTDYTIRVTVTSRSRPTGLAFVEGPDLGVRNVEFALGPFNKGESATVTGFIKVSRTDTSILPKTVFQSESLPFHQIGRREGNAWSVRVGDPKKKYATYGPYVTSLAAGRRTATFRLMLDNVSADNTKILTIDVYDATTGRQLKSMDITRQMFNKAFTYKKFTLDFDAIPGHMLEFRTFWHGNSYMRQDSVVIR